MRMRTGIDTLLALTFLPPPPPPPPPPQSSKLGILSLSSMTGLRVNRMWRHEISVLFVKTLGIKCNLWESYTKKEYFISPILFIYLVRENSLRFATPLQISGQISPPWKVLVTRAEIPYWWRVTAKYPDLGSAYAWSKQISPAARPVRNTTQIWFVTCHQYGISAFVLQTSARGNRWKVAGCFLRLLYTKKVSFTLKWSTAASSYLSGSIFVINLKCKQKKKGKPVTNFSACFIFKSDGTQIGKISKPYFKLPHTV